MTTLPPCTLCVASAEQVLWRDAQLRIVLVDDAYYGGFCRVIWQAHVREMTDLAPAARAHLMQAVWAVERSLREYLLPAKINLASLGNQVPHLHWHVIPRYTDDPHFPSPIWTAPKRAAPKKDCDPILLKERLLANLTAGAA